MTSTLRRETPAARSAPRALRQEIRRVLEQGGLVALGTETVYGLAARADLPAAVERLMQLKGRDAKRALSWHVGTAEVLDSFAELPHSTRRLADRYWPGPLTLVLHGIPAGLEGVAREGWTGVRLPAHDSTRSILRAMPFPVVMTSANLTGEDPRIDAAGVLETFEGRIELLVDSGRARISESSTVIALGRGRFEILREGLLSPDDLRRAAGLSIGFVCTGNTCRSPMAEQLARHGMARQLDVPVEGVEEFGFRFLSAGVMAGMGAPASPHAVEILAAEGMDLSRHSSRPASVELVAGLDRIYCLTNSHRESLRAGLPPSKGKSIELLDPTGYDIPDPMGGNMEDYKACAERIRSVLELRFEEWL
jgi:tRNA threonylcarbamoyl adenosine modification protein (Sua5/YciO/YrdC/YwlC family)